MPLKRNEVATLIDHAAVAQREHFESLAGRNFVLPLAATNAVGAWAFDSQITALATHANADGATATRRQVTLRDTFARGGRRLIIARDQKFTFNLQCHNFAVRLLQR